MDNYRLRRCAQPLSNGYILPVGQLIRNALFVGGIESWMDIQEEEMRYIFARFGEVKEVKLFKSRERQGKGYGFVYFSEEVNIDSIIDKDFRFEGVKLQLGPAIMRERYTPFRRIFPAPGMCPTQYFYCMCNWSLAQPLPVLSVGGPYSQPYYYSCSGGVMVVPQMPVNYTHYRYSS